MVTQTPADDNLDMAQLLDEAEKSHPNLERGQVVDGVIMKVDRDSILVHIGAKSEGVVPAREMRSLPPESVDELAVGDTLLVAVVKAETDDGQAILSVDRARGEVGWRKLQEYADNGTVIDAEVTGYNRGGAVVTAEGVQGFVPMSQLTTVSRPPADAQDNPELAALVGKTLRLKVIEVSRRRNRAILSERAATQEQRQAQKERLLEELREGEIRKGRVSGITNFGAFVDLGGADGLIHISELSWDSVRSPEEIVTVGDNVDVFVIKVDKEAKRIALSLKRTQTEPWADVAEKYRVGEVTEATITKLASFGAFARIEGSIEGLIHISELADRIIQHPREIVHEGEQVAVRIVKVEADRRRIGLSLKQVKDVEAAEALERYQQGQTEHRVERPALDAGTAAQLEEAMAASAADAPAEEPAAESATETVEATVEAPAEEPAAESATETVEATVDAPAEEPAAESATETVEATVDPPAEEPAEERAAEPEQAAELTEPATPSMESTEQEPQAVAEDQVEVETVAEQPVGVVDDEGSRKDDG